MSQIKEILEFLSKLSKNNTREWFAANKEEYQHAYAVFVEFIGLLIDKISVFDEDIATLEPKKCVFRIYRDVRFSNDKSPYKTNFGADISPQGRKSPFASYYLHIEPDNCFVAGGMYHPEVEILNRIRQEIDYNPDLIHSILEDPKFHKAFKELQGDKLKRPPKGYAADHPDVELLKHKDFIVFKKIQDKTVVGNGFLKVATDYYKLIKPLNDFLNMAIEGS